MSKILGAEKERGVERIYAGGMIRVLNPRLFVKFVTLVVLLGYLVHLYILRDCYDRRHNNTKDKYSYHKYPLLLHDILLSVVIISNFADGIFKQSLQKSLSYQQNRKTDCNSNHCQSGAFLCRHFFSPYSVSFLTQARKEGNVLWFPGFAFFFCSWSLMIMIIHATYIIFTTMVTPIIPLLSAL